MSIKILKPGLLTTLVDSGRTGFRKVGIGAGGAMDNFAMTVANYLAGNDKISATMEIHFPGPEIFFERDSILSISGMGFRAKVNDKVIPLWKPIQVSQGSIMKFEKITGGCRAYLAVNGGWKAEEWLGSFSTNSGVRAGGHLGRPLQKNDVLEMKTSGRIVDKEKALSWSISTSELDKVYFPSGEIRIIASGETALLSPLSREEFLSAPFIIDTQSNRMGYRLEGPSLQLNQPLELISSPVDFGTIQLLPNGNLIILMADHQTTGGYPRIASVIYADLPKLAQRSPGEKINFKMVAFEEAESKLLSRKKQLEELRTNCLNQFRRSFPS